MILSKSTMSHEVKSSKVAKDNKVVRESQCENPLVDAKTIKKGKEDKHVDHVEVDGMANDDKEQLIAKNKENPKEENDKYEEEEVAVENKDIDLVAAKATLEDEACDENETNHLNILIDVCECASLDTSKDQTKEAIEIIFKIWIFAFI